MRISNYYLIITEKIDPVWAELRREDKLGPEKCQGREVYKKQEGVGHSNLDLLIDAYKEKQSSGIFVTGGR